MENRKRKKSKKWKRALLIVEVILLLMLTLSYYLSAPIATKRILYIPKGSIDEIIAHLNRYDGNDLNQIDRFVLRLIGYPQHGWIDMKTDSLMSRGDYLYQLTKAKAAMMSATLIPGETTVLFFEQVARKFNLSSKRLYRIFLELSPMEEGALAPDTYFLPKGANERLVVRILLSRSKKQHKRISYKIFNNYSKTKWFYYLRVASIIEKESANATEMPLVASVIYNRLKKKMRLQMDGSLNYGRHSHTKVTAKRIRNDKSRYNTYKYNGVPPVPICNVSIDAIRAAIFPAHSNYLYFVKNSKGVHTFSSQYKNHLREIKRGKN